MADLRVKDEWVGPGEKKTAEHLRDTLPDDWVIFAGRKLAGENRDDVDLIVVGRGKIFVLDEKSWGPRLVVDDSYWYVNGQTRQNPIGRVGQLSRKVATKLRDHASGYKQVPGKRVVPGIVLSHDQLQILAGRNHDISENVWHLAAAAAEMVKIDGAENPIGHARNAVIAYLDDLPAGGKIQMLGEYRVVSRIAVPGQEQAYEAIDSADRPVVLKCYPVAALEEFGNPTTFLRRETEALNKLAQLGRAWQALPFFRDDAYGLFVVPVVRPPNARSLATSLKDLDPERPDGRLPDDVARNVVIDAYTALAEVHEETLVHRALHPGRIWLGRALRVMFSDFHLARIDGAQTIAAWEPDEDSSDDYRAPECAVSVAAATPRSDVFSLTMCLVEWLLGEPAPELTVEQLQERLVKAYSWAEPMNVALGDAGFRPTAGELALSLKPKPEPVVATGPKPDEFTPGGVVGGRYRIEEKLGEGGFAVTWKVFDTQSGHHKVLKQFKHAMSQTLQEEYLAANQLSHDCCGRVYDIQVDKTPPYLVQEYVEGQTLNAPGLSRSLDEVRQIAQHVLSALAYIHGKGLLHGDVTPANIVAANDGSGIAKLIDFGLASPAGQRAHGWTPKFAAPEVLDGKPTNASSDLFGFAASLAYAMLGRPVTRIDDGRVSIVELTPDDLRVWGDDGEALLRTLLKGVELNPADRPPSAEAFLTLVRAARPVTTSNVPDTPVELTEVHNETVTAIRRLYRGSAAGNAGNRGLDDQFAKDTYVPTMLDTELLPRVVAGELDVVLLSGNPGDGKTSVLVQLGDQLRSDGAIVEHEDEAGWRLRLGDRLFTAVYDASESHGDLSSDQLVSAALDAVVDSDKATALIAVNDGRLLQFFEDHDEKYETWGFDVKDQLEGKETPGSRLALVDLKRRSLAGEDGRAGPALKALAGLVDDSHWQDCSTCVAQHDCPILANRNSLMGRGGDAFNELVRISHLRRRRRATFRDVRSAIAWLITGDRSCADIHMWRSAKLSAMQLERALISELAFSADSNDYLVTEWSELDPAQVAAPGVDRIFRTQGASSQHPVYNGVDAVARALYFGLVRDNAEQTDRSSVMSYRYLDEFTAMLRNECPERARDRLLLGISRIVGAYGYTDGGLAMSSGMPGAAWAILHTVPVSEFEVSIDDVRSPYVETIADRLILSHTSKPSITLSLDTAEVILRAADGELVNDLASDAILQEIDAFVSQLARRPSSEARVVDSSGSVAVARIDGTQIVLEDA